jgi:hypothetical protein
MAIGGSSRRRWIDRIRTERTLVSDDSSEQSFRFWIIFLGILAFILFVGWKQPLRYRFMSQQENDVLEKPVTTPIPATPKPQGEWMRDRKSRTLLDR